MVNMILNISTNMVIEDGIDKEAPIAELIYSTTNPTDKPVTVTMKTDEEVTVTNNNGSKEYTFTENGKFTFEYIDKLGNIGTAEAEVTWINKEQKMNFCLTLKNMK